MAHAGGMALTGPRISDRAFTAVPREGLTRAEVMTASEVAELLHLPVSTVYYLARRGEIPACRLGRAWRFLRPRLEELLGS
jgi:excisionase family DNA binding protein